MHVTSTRGTQYQLTSYNLPDGRVGLKTPDWPGLHVECETWAYAIVAIREKIDDAEDEAIEEKRALAKSREKMAQLWAVRVPSAAR
jgi:hypothetical protein